jgi:hypothetical protein
MTDRVNEEYGWNQDLPMSLLDKIKSDEEIHAEQRRGSEERHAID